MTKIVEVDCAKITNLPSFHDTFAKAFGFPDFYGRNLDAWIDCMTCLDETMSDVEVDVGDTVTLQLSNAASLKSNAPDILTAVFEMAAFVNF
ncbi:MAG: barstar family protein, partial [Planktomarina sp.]